MTSEATDRDEAEQIKEVIRLLNLALACCHKSLAEAERRLKAPAENDNQLRLTH